MASMKRKNLSELISESPDKLMPEKALSKQFKLFELEIGTLTTGRSKYKQGGRYYSFYKDGKLFCKIPHKALNEDREHDVLKHIFLIE